MKRERIGGIGSVSGGEYDSIQIDGIGKLKGRIKANQISASGMSRSKGEIEASLLNINGIHKAKRTIKVREAAINGVLRLKTASLHADKINCTGCLYCGRELSADQISIQGIFSISHIYGDTVRLVSDETAHLPIGRKSRLFCRLLLASASRTEPPGQITWNARSLWLPIQNLKPSTPAASRSAKTARSIKFTATAL